VVWEPKAKGPGSKQIRTRRYLLLSSRIAVEYHGRGYALRVAYVLEGTATAFVFNLNVEITV
jgi:hypothetical protein